MSSDAATREAAEIIERILAAMPRGKAVHADEREAYLRGVVAAWRAVAGDPGKG